MKGATRLLVRPRAAMQITAAIQYYAVTMQTPSAAKGFVDELQRAYELIKRNPDAGSPRLEAELAIPSLRSWKLPRYPYLLVYFRHPDFADVVDVPHTRTDYVAALINYLGSPRTHLRAKNSAPRGPAHPTLLTPPAATGPAACRA